MSVRWISCVCFVSVVVSISDEDFNQLADKFEALMTNYQNEISWLKTKIEIQNKDHQSEIEGLKAKIEVQKKDHQIEIERLIAKTEVLETLMKTKCNENEDQSTTNDEEHGAFRFSRDSKRLLVSGVPDATSHKVGFSAALTHDASLGYLQTVLYDKVITNIGNAYDPSDGHLIAPIKGLYLLSTTLFNTQGHVQPMEIVKNGIQLAALFADDKNYNMATQTIVVVLEQNDKVWVRRFRDQSAASIYGRPNQPYNTFSGVLLFSM